MFQSCPPPWGYFERLVIPIRNYKLVKKSVKDQLFFDDIFYVTTLACH